MIPSDWTELARSRAFSDAKKMVIYHYYERDKPLEYLAEWLGVALSDLRALFRAYHLPLREEDKADGRIRENNL